MEYTYRELTREDFDKFIKEMSNQPLEEKREWMLFPWTEAQQKAFDEAMKESFKQLLLYGECQVKIDKDGKVL